MLELIKRAKIISVICIAIIVLFNYFVIFRLMKHELEESVTANFIELSSSRHASLKNTIDASVDSAKALSSRSMIKEKIIEYLEGDVSLDELSSFTQPKYIDGATVLENIIGAARIVDGNIIAGYNDPGYAIDLDAADPSESLSASIIMSGGKHNLLVDSPVREGGTLLAVDRVVFDISQSIDALSDAQNSITVLDSAEAQVILSESEILMQKDDFALCLSNGNYLFFRQLLGPTHVMISTQRSILLRPINQLTIKMLASTAVVFLGMLIVFYVTIIRFANKLLETAEKNRNKFENLAYRDELTGAYSRTFLDFWKENLFVKGNPYCIIMIDLDELKDINDCRGHLVGDKVLKIVASAVTRTIRTGDIFIRFGGDEFLLIIENIKESTGENIMRRVEAKLNENHGMDFKVSLSYGVYAMETESDFNDAILMADRRMYMTKKLKKEKLNEVV